MHHIKMMIYRLKYTLLNLMKRRVVMQKMSEIPWPAATQDLLYAYDEPCDNGA